MTDTWHLKIPDLYQKQEAENAVRKATAERNLIDDDILKILVRAIKEGSLSPVDLMNCSDGDLMRMYFMRCDIKLTLAKVGKKKMANYNVFKVLLEILEKKGLMQNDPIDYISEGIQTKFRDMFLDE